MKEISNPHEFQKEMKAVRRRGLNLGFVPTMGAFHEGHLALVRKAKEENDRVAVSIFVNPLQFGPHEDFQRYPHRVQDDRLKLGKEKVDFLFLPKAGSLFPAGYQTFVEVTKLSRGLCGRFRPGHFRGVATIVCKLFHLAQPTRAYFGAKDYQQAVIVQRMAEDLNFDLEVKLFPVVRDRDGLALSSRNVYLSLSERRRALSIPKTIGWARCEIRRGARNLDQLRKGVLKRLRPELDRIDYVEFVHPKTLEPVRAVKGRLVMVVAGWAGKTRLIDNAILSA